MFRSLLLALTLVVLVKNTDAFANPDFCQNKICPSYTVIATNADFEEREYEESVWMTTSVASSSTNDIVAASNRLKDFTAQQSVKIADTWPGLITVAKTVSGAEQYSMSWLVPPGVTLSNSIQDSVEIKTIAKSTVYVRSFGGTPSIESGQQNADQLKQDLTNAGKSFNPDVFYGAGYDSFFSLTHHNEIWYFKV